MPSKRGDPLLKRKKRRLRKIYAKKRAKRPQTHKGQQEKRLSVSAFVENVRRRLNTSGYSEELMDTIMQEAAPFLAKLTSPQRRQVENFLYGARWKLSTASSPAERDKMLRNSKAWKRLHVDDL